MRHDANISTLAAALFAALGIVPLAAQAATIMVTTIGDSGTASACTLRQAIQSMNTGDVTGTGCSASGTFGTGDTIQFSAAAFPAGGANTITLAGGELAISTVSLGIDATANGNVTIDANQASRVMDDNATNGDLTLSHLTLRNGTAAYGGGIHAKPSVPYAKAVNITLNSSTLSGNTATGTNFTTGGGIYAYGATITLNDSTVSGNSAAFGGGGIYDDGGAAGTFTVTLNNSTVNGNSAQIGGGINVTVANTGAARVILNSSTVSGNTATSIFSNVLGGGIYVYKGKVYLTNSTLSGNSADGASAVGGGLAVAQGDSSTVASYNTIFAANTAASGGNIAVVNTSFPFTITGNNNLLFGGASSLSQASFNNAPITGDPKLTALAHFGGPTKTRFPLAGSAAVDAISAAGCMAATDQRGYVRPDAGSASATPCDVGAVEADAATRNDIIFINGLDL